MKTESTYVPFERNDESLHRTYHADPPAQELRPERTSRLRSQEFNSRCKSVQSRKISFLMSKLNRWSEEIAITCTVHKQEVTSFCHVEKCFLCDLCTEAHADHRDQISKDYVIEKTIRDTEVIHQQLRDIRDFFDGQITELERIVEHRQVDSRKLENYLMRSSALLSNQQLMSSMKARPKPPRGNQEQSLFCINETNIFTSIDPDLEPSQAAIKKSEAVRCPSPRQSANSNSQLFPNNGIGLEIWQSAVMGWPKKMLENSISTSFDICSCSSILKKRNQEVYIRSLFTKLPVANQIFRASKHDFRAEAFHKVCDGKFPLLLLFETTDNKIFGAYVTQPFDSSGTFKEAPGSFLFSITENAKMEIYKSQKNAMYCNELYGPTFGCGYDLFIPCSANIRECSSRLGYTYALPPKMRVNSAEANSFLASKSKFLLKEYEAYHLDFDVFE